MPSSIIFYRHDYETLAQYVTISNSLNLPISTVLILTTPDLPAHKEDFPQINYWTRQSWNEDSKKNGASDVNCQGVSECGQSHVAKGVNVTMQYIEDEQGQMIDGHRAAAIWTLVCLILIALANAGKAPTKWSQADVMVTQGYRCKMQQQFPEL